MTGSTRTVDATAAWAASGAMALSGPPPGGTTGPPAGLVEGVRSLQRRIADASRTLGSPVTIDALALLGERAALDGLVAGGRTSGGGATRLLACRDGWLAVAQARPSDVDAVPAWLALAADLAGDLLPVDAPTEHPDRRGDERAGIRCEPGDRTGSEGRRDERRAARRAGGPRLADDPADGDGPPWAAIERGVRRLPGAALVEAATVLGLPVGLLGERAVDTDGGVTVHRVTSRPRRRQGRPLVVDLSALWAGPLCGSLLGLAGCDVVKVESEQRPDAARHGSPDLYDLLNGDKAHRRVDLATATGRAELVALVASADVVVEASRPRALGQLGVVADELLAAPDGPTVWVSITGHGRRSPRVAFGDDAAVAGGLVVHTDDGPWFCADAVADPLSGLAGGAAALELLADAGAGLVEVAMAGVAAAHAGPTLPAGTRPVAPPNARERRRTAPERPG